MQTGLRTSRTAGDSSDSAAFFLLGDLLSRAEERAGHPTLRPSDLSRHGPLSPMQSGYFWCSVVCPIFPIISRMTGRCRPDRFEPERRRPDEPLPEPPRRDDDPDVPGER